ncbi:hypothetical protein M4D49_28665 [Cupriavidus pauculus]|jgi:hypothetical protein|uniref:hypothetical protein n=1 Tax=Cupriavidus TaxID=106589 RepID=UPI00203B6283|nr:hypothetical protein [Cupriavidus pauculus]MCM3609455.1 hypothetical protein [Cupriavidus pauculus]
MSSSFNIEDVTPNNFWLVGVGELARAKREDVRGFEVRPTGTGFQVVLALAADKEKGFLIGAEFGDQKGADSKRDELQKKYFN